MNCGREIISPAFIYVKTNKNLKTKAGKSYYSLLLQDKTGTVDAKVWDLNNGIEHFESMDFIKVDGMVTSFQGALQVNVPAGAPDPRSRSMTSGIICRPAVFPSMI